MSLTLLFPLQGISLALDPLAVKISFRNKIHLVISVMAQTGRLLLHYMNMEHVIGEILILDSLRFDLLLQYLL